jgi:hypothetical protein
VVVDWKLSDGTEGWNFESKSTNNYWNERNLVELKWSSFSVVGEIGINKLSKNPC